MRILQISPQLHALQFPEVNDLNVFVWNDDAEVSLIDSGPPGSAEEIGRGLAELGFEREQVRRLVITHAHADHIGAAAAIRDWGAQVLVHRADAGVVRGSRVAPPPVLREWEIPIAEALPPFSPPPPSPVDRELDDADRIAFGGGAEVIAVPGHTAGSIALHLARHRLLFTGDTLANVGGVTMPGVFNADSAAVEDAVARLAGLEVETICVGHGDVLFGAAAAAWRAGQGVREGGWVPPWDQRCGRPTGRRAGAEADPLT
ncbi:MULTISPECIES: MBL fold metallo-hydrolase [Nocardia]|uniref:MBL fold metallo-hydrolase n=1 Tax=Nocardia TaxID=1817 RepID=UPI0013597D1B|nr:MULTISPECIES: MBL fold metallo-hydrolase [Nocardia]